MFSTYLQLVFDSLKRQKSRTVLTMLAISIGIAIVIVIMAAGKGIERLIMGQLDVYGADTISITARPPNKSSGSGDVGITITSLKDKDIQQIERLPNISAAYGSIMSQEAVSYNGQIKKVFVMGEGARASDIEKITFTRGNFFTEDDENSLNNVVVLGSAAKEKLFGQQEAVGQIMYIRGKTFRVIGVLASRGSALFFDMDNILIIPTKTMQKKLLGIDYVSTVNAKMKNAAESARTKEDIVEILRENHSISDPNRDDFEVSTMAEAAGLIANVASGITLLLVALVGISLVVGGVGIMNIMYVSVAERTFEIGLRKSLGAKRKDIVWQFLLEAIVMTVGGGIIGVLVGALLALAVYALAVSSGFAWVYEVSLSSIVLSVGFSAIIGLVFGLYPARKASLLSPIDALRRE
jgi:putative ABC transport system permease protein